MSIPTAPGEAPSTSRRLIAALAILLGGEAVLLGLRQPGSHAVLFLTAQGIAFTGLGLAYRALRHRSLGIATLLAVAALQRLLLLPLPPALSDDIYRYVWDGRVNLAGQSPYLLAPDDERLAGLRDELWAAMPHRDVETVYPPTALGIFSIAAALPQPRLAYKLMLCLVDLAGCGLLLRLAERVGVPRARVVWYAWSPLVAFEGAGMGHVDLLGVPAMIAAVSWLMPGTGDEPRGRGAWASCTGGIALALAILVKLVPVLPAPAWIRSARRPLLAGLAMSGLTVAALAPVVAASGGPPPGLVRYGVSWEFNGPLFEPLWRALDSAGAVPMVKAALDRAKDATRGRVGAERWNALYPYVYPQLLAKLLLGFVLVAVVVRAAFLGPLPAGLTALGAALLLSATVYPWYVTWTLPFAALLGAWPWLILTLSVQLAYLPRLTGGPYTLAVYLAVWLPMAGCALVAVAMRRRRRSVHGG